MYLLIEQDGTLSEVETLPDSISWDCWPKAVKIELYAGPDYCLYELKEEGWGAIEEKI